MRKMQSALPLTLFTCIVISSLANAAPRADNAVAQIDAAAPAETSQEQIPSTGQPAAVQQAPAAQQPAAVPQAPLAPRAIERVEPAAIPVAASSKSQDQLEYEANMQIRFDGFAKTIKALESQLETLSKKEQRAVLDSLRTAQGNRSVARTKLKQLRFIAPAQWTSVRAGIERAMTDLEVSVQRVEGMMNPKQ